MTSMKVTLICHAPGLASQLAQLARAEGLDGAQLLPRAKGEPLAPLLAQAEGDLVVVDAGDTDADLSVLEALAPARPALSLILLSARRDADTLLRAMRAGIREVLPNPPEPAEFAAALRRLAQRSPPADARGRIISFVACKGGSGATFLATNLAYILATEHKRRVALLDLDLQYGDAAYFVTDQPVHTSLADLARQVDHLDASLLDSSMVRVTDHFSLLASPEQPEDALGITGFQLERVIDMARDNYDIVLLDIERMLDPLSIKGLDKAEAIYLVTENMIPHVRDARRLVRILRALGYPDSKLRLVVNRHDRGVGLDQQQVEKAVGLKVAFTIPDSLQEVAEAVNTGVPVVQIHPHNAVSRALRELASTVAEGAGKTPRKWLARLIGEPA